MNFNPKLTQVTLIKRYKRFLADVRLESGQEITVHCPNTGSMKNCIVPESKAWISDSGNEKRKYRHTWELTTTPGGSLASINTHRANALIFEAIQAGKISQLTGYNSIKTEVKYGDGSRIDLLLERHPIDNRPVLC